MEISKLILSKRSLNFQTPMFVLICALAFACSQSPPISKQVWVENDEINVRIDTIMVNPAKSSQIGSFYLRGEALFYVDNLYGVIEEFTADGDSKGIKKKVLDGPDELLGISELIPTKEGYIVRNDWTLYRYDSIWEFKGKSIFQSESTVSYDEMMDNPKGEYLDMYELYHYNQKSTELPDGQLATKLDVEHPIFNAFTSRAYYRESRVLGKVDPSTGMMAEMLGTRPDSYEQYKFIPFHVMMDYHWTKDNAIYVTYEPDSMIYVYDSQWQLKDTFGARGLAMKTNYAESQSLDVAFESDLFFASRNKDGYYKDIFVDEENGLIFRSYRQGSDRQDLLDETENPLRIQVFHKGKLIEDFSAPGRFRILGKVGDRYVADGYFDERNEKQGFYLLKIN